MAEAGIKRATAVSLFSGAGGLDIGVELAGFVVRCAVEINEFAAETLRLNQWIAQASYEEFTSWFLANRIPYRSWNPEAIARVRSRVALGVGRKSDRPSRCAVIAQDIRCVTSLDIATAAGIAPGQLDLLLGGPPCQPFSRAGQRQAIDDERGQLFLEFVRIANDLRPRWILFENVKGLVQTKANVWRLECKRCLKSGVPPFDPDAPIPGLESPVPVCDFCGSPRTAWKVDRMKPGGSLDWIQSSFDRIGYKTIAFLLNAADYGVPQRRERVFLLGTRDGEALRCPEPTHDMQSHVTLWDTLFSEPNADHQWPLDPDVAVLWVKNVVRPHDEPVTWDLRLPSPTIGAHQGAKLAIAPNGVPQEQLQRQQWHVLGHRQGDTPPVKVEHTYLSDRDLLLLQTFPEYWYVAGTRMDRAFQIGNAVPPLLGKHVAETLSNGCGQLITNNRLPRAVSKVREQ